MHKYLKIQPLDRVMPTDRTTIRLTDERQRKLDQAAGIISKDDIDDPPMSDVIDAALTHLIESERNMQQAREEYDPETIQSISNTSVLKLHFRTSIDSPWRS